MTYGPVVPVVTGYVVMCLRQAMDVKTRSCNYCSGRKEISITYSECVILALGIRHGKRVRHTVICGLSGLTLFCRIFRKRRNFWKKVAEHKMCILCLLDRASSL